jgi:hypothetical protein
MQFVIYFTEVGVPEENQGLWAGVFPMDKEEKNEKAWYVHTDFDGWSWNDRDGRLQ